MTDAGRTRPLEVAVLLADPRFPYPYALGGRIGAEEQEAFRQVRESLAGLEGYRFRFLDDHPGLLDALRERPPDLALNLCDTGFKNDWDLERNVPSLLEILEIPYTGSDPLAISLATDKAVVRALASSRGVLVPNEVFVDLTADPFVMPAAYPALVKPNASGGSFGIEADCVVHDASEAEACLRRLAGLLRHPEAVMQDFLTGPEYTMGLVGNPETGFTVLPPLEVDYSALDPELPPILTYGSKADPSSPYWAKVRSKPAEIDEVTHARMLDACAKLFARIGFRDYARFDFRCGSDGRPRLLDANANPNWSWDGKMATMAGWAGHDYAAFLGGILEAACGRCGIGAAAS